MLVSGAYQQTAQGCTVALTDTLTKTAKHRGKLAGDKHSDGGGLYHHDLCHPARRMLHHAYKWATFLFVGIFPVSALGFIRKLLYCYGLI